MQKKIYERPEIELISFEAKERLAGNPEDNLSDFNYPETLDGQNLY